MTMPATRAGSDQSVPIASDQGRAEYNARRAYAYTIGEEHAIQRTISADAYLFLYKELVRLCMNRTYCWAGVDWLARRLQTSQGTVKRWLTQLVSAGLIQRKPRPGGDTALTTIPALQVYDQQARADQPPTPPVFARSPETVDPHSPPPPTIRPSEPSFFVLTDRIKAESYAGSALSRHTIKKLDLNLGSVGFGTGAPEQARPIHVPRSIDTPSVRRLIEAGVADPSVLHELAVMPIAEIEAICRYVAQQPDCYNPPGLIVALARTGLGPALLHRRESSAKRRRGAGSMSPRRSTGSASCPTAIEPLAVTQGTAEQSEWSALWVAAKQLLAERTSAAEFAAWIDITKLVGCRDGEAIIGAPNVFARDTLLSTYRSSIAEVLRTLTSVPVTVEVVID